MALVSPRALREWMGAFAVLTCLALFDLGLQFAGDPSVWWRQGPSFGTYEELEAAFQRVRYPVPTDGSALQGYWGRTLRLEVTGTGWRIHSLGRDGEPGGSGPDRDLWMDERGSMPAVLPDVLDSGAPRQALLTSALLAALMLVPIGGLSFLMRLAGAEANARLGCGLSVIAPLLAVVHAFNSMALEPWP